MQSKETLYLTVAHVIGLHAFIMEHLGFVPAPLRDEGGLESAVTRPRMAEYYEGADVVRQAALLAVGISQAQAFLDGNKRTAYIATEVFLERNGFKLTDDPLDLAQQLELVAVRADDLDAATDRFEDWLRSRVTRSN